MKFSKRNRKKFKKREGKISQLTTVVEIIKTESQDQIIQKDNILELKKINLSNFYIHNKLKYKTGIAMIKEDNRLIRVPIFPKYIFNKRTRRYSWKYYVQ